MCLKKILSTGLKTKIPCEDHQKQKNDTHADADAPFRYRGGSTLLLVTAACEKNCPASS